MTNEPNQSDVAKLREACVKAEEALRELLSYCGIRGLIGPCMRDLADGALHLLRAALADAPQSEAALLDNGWGDYDQWQQRIRERLAKNFAKGDGLAEKFAELDLRLSACLHALWCETLNHQAIPAPSPPAPEPIDHETLGIIKGWQEPSTTAPAPPPPRYVYVHCRTCGKPLSAKCKGWDCDECVKAAESPLVDLEPCDGPLDDELGPETEAPPPPAIAPAPPCGTCEGPDCEGCEAAPPPPSGYYCPACRIYWPRSVELDRCGYCSGELERQSTPQTHAARNLLAGAPLTARFDSDGIPPPPQPEPFDTEAIRQRIDRAANAAHLQSAWSGYYRRDMAAALDQIARLQPFEARCHAIDQAEQRLAARSEADAEAGTKKPEPFDREAARRRCESARIGHHSSKLTGLISERHEAVRGWSAALDEIARLSEENRAQAALLLSRIRLRLRLVGWQCEYCEEQFADRAEVLRHLPTCSKNPMVAEIERLTMEANLHRETIEAQDEQVERLKRKLDDAAEKDKQAVARAEAAEQLRVPKRGQVVMTPEEREDLRRENATLATEVERLTHVYGQQASEIEDLTARAEAAERELAAVTADRDRLREAAERLKGVVRQFRLDWWPDSPTLLRDEYDAETERIIAGPVEGEEKQS